MNIPKLKNEKEILARWKSDLDKPVVSICCITYNHENYIKEALDSFLMQETEFPFEILIHDDASTDRTADIIRQYEEKYPNIIKPIYQTENQYSKGIEVISTFNLSRSKGRYIAICEGDDYWTDHKKLQKQFEVLQKNKQCSFSFHNTMIVKNDGHQLMPRNKIITQGNSREEAIDRKFIISQPLLIAHISSIFFRSEYFDKKLFHYLGKFSGSDYFILVMLCHRGNGYYFDDSMSAYRINPTSLSNSRVMDKEWLNEIYRGNKKISAYYNYIYHKEIMNNYKGHLMNKLTQDVYENATKKKINKFIWSVSHMALNHKNSQYTLRDILWIMRDALKITSKAS